MKPRILIIDTDEIESKKIQRALEKMTYSDCDIITEGAYAIDKVKTLHPELVLIETVLDNGTNGIELADQIQGQLNIPVIFLTSHAEKEIIEQAKAISPFGYLLKPANGSELVIAIEMGIYRSQMEQRLAKNTRDLNDRIKKLNCLYGISSLRENPYLSLNEILQGIVNLLPQSCRFPDEAFARIVLNKETYVSPQFREAPKNQGSDIKVNGEVIGQVEIHCVSETPEEERCIQDEKNLLKAVSERLGRIIERQLSDQALHAALNESQRRQTEISALLKGASAVLEYREFKDAARIIFNSCRELIGASAGYVALLSKDGSENELLFLESGELVCTVDPRLPMPIRGLRGEAYRTGKVAFHNDFSHSQWVRFMPEGHVDLESVLFAPLVIKGKVLGLLGLANKPGGFIDDDFRIASAFSELAAIALYNSQTLESLEDNEKRIRSVVETASEGIISINNKNEIVFWNRSAEILFGYTEKEIIGKPTTLIMPERFRKAHRQRLQQIKTTDQIELTKRPLELTGLKQDGSEFPIELSLASWQTHEGFFFTGIIRDITERKAAEKAISDTQNELEKRVEERTIELSRANRELQRLSAELLKAHEEESKRIGQELHDGLAQSLSAIKVWIESAIIQLRQNKPAPEVSNSLESIVNLAKRAVEDVRRISRNMRPSILDDLGILATISWLCQEFEAVYREIKIEKHIFIEENDIPEKLKIVIFRILQEALNNIAKHSQATFSLVTLGEKNGTIELKINDNGAGFDVENTLFMEKPERGLGLASMKERSKLSGGSFSIESSPHIGTTVYVSWPMVPSPP